MKPIRSHPARPLYPQDTPKLGDLLDVQAPVPADGDVLTWVDADGRWEPMVGGSASGSFDYGAITEAASAATQDWGTL